MTVSAQDDVAEFAALLRKLKERTDRSYGSLARRLDMNTSTLHRYCAGEAVPVDFAPVERFAALCGASRTERLDLHHRWLRAAEARRRPRGAPGSTGPEADPAAGPAPDPDPGTDPGQRTDPSTAPDSSTALNPGTDPDPSTAPGPGTDPHPGTRGSGRASDSAVESDVVSGPLSDEARVRRPWYRRRERVAVALAAACALLATVGSLSALPDDRRTPTGRGPTAESPSVPEASGPGAASRGRTSSPSPSPSPSPSGSATAKSGPSAPEPRHESDTPSTPAGSKAPAGSPPLTWSADSHVWAYGCGHDYVIAEPPEQVPPPPAPQDAGTWAATQSAVHGGETLVELSVQGTSETAVVLTALRVRVAGRSEPAPGNAYAMDQGCGGALTPRSFDVDLDKDRPTARAVAGNDAGTPIPAVRMPYRVSVTDPEVLRVTARTANCDCRWYLELDWSSRGRTGTVRVDDHGRPFRTSGIGGLPHYEYDTSARGWKPRTR